MNIARDVDIHIFTEVRSYRPCCYSVRSLRPIKESYLSSLVLCGLSDLVIVSFELCAERLRRCSIFLC